MPELAAALVAASGTRADPSIRLEPHRLVFLEETGTTTKMTHLRGAAA